MNHPTGTRSLPGFLLLAFSLVWFLAACQPTAQLGMTLEMTTVNGEPVPLQNGRPMISFDPQERPVTSLAGEWKKLRRSVDHNLTLSARTPFWFQRVAAELEGAHQAGFDDSGWDTHAIPGVENIMPETPDDPSGPEIFEQAVYYRRTVHVPADWEGRVVRLVCLAADYVADVWVNGQWAGVHEGGYAPFALDVSDKLEYGRDNLVFFRVDALYWMIRHDILPSWFATDWMHYAGIVQDVYLEASPPVHVVRGDVIPQSVEGDLRVSVVLENRSSAAAGVNLRLRVFALDREHPGLLSDPVAANLLGGEAALEGVTERVVTVPPGAFTCEAFAVRIPEPDLWSPADPNLYVLRVEVEDGEQNTLDRFSSQFGVRTVETGPGAKVLLNGRPVFFTGMARHEDWPDSGRTATMEKIARDLQVIRDTNVWFLRTSHYPNHPYTSILTDRMGFAVWEEIPAWWINTLSVDILLKRGLPVQMWREMIWNGRNRPSVLFWSLCNEPMWYFVSNLRQYVQHLRADVYNHPDGRLVTQSLAADGAAVIGDAQLDVDVAGWTMYFGVFYGQDITAETRAFLLEQHARMPDKPILVCEYGYWSGSGGSEEPEQVRVANETLDAMLPLAAVDETGAVTDGFLAGVTWWCQFNWYRVQTPRIQSMGITRMDRETHKPVRTTLVDRYAPYFNMGGLAAE